MHAVGISEMEFLLSVWRSVPLCPITIVVSLKAPKQKHTY